MLMKLWFVQRYIFRVWIGKRCLYLQTKISALCLRKTCLCQRLCIILKYFNPCGFAPVQVVLVRWNEPFQKLATCDMEGGIFVWIQYEGRWSVELVNDRGAQVYYSYSLYFLVYQERTNVIPKMQMNQNLNC